MYMYVYQLHSDEYAKHIMTNICESTSPKTILKG